MSWSSKHRFGSSSKHIAAGYHRHFITFHTSPEVMSVAMVIEPEVDRDETQMELWVAVKAVNAAAACAQGYLTCDKFKQEIGWYLGLRQSQQEAVNRLRQITERAREPELQKSEIVVIRFSFTAAGFAKYASQLQAHPPFAPLLAKQLYYRDNTDWGVWYFRGNQLPLLEHHPETGKALVSSSMHKIE